MAGLSDYAEDKLVDHITGKTSYTKPTNTYLALFTAAPSDSGGGTEVSGGSYARQTLAWNASSAGHADNSADITFPQATGNWGTITHIGVMDASTAGNLLFWGALTASKAIDTGDTFKILAADLDLTLD